LLVLLSISQQNPLKAVLLMQPGRVGKMSDATKKPRSDTGANQPFLPGFGGEKVACRDRGYSVGEVLPWGWSRWKCYSVTGWNYSPEPKKPSTISIPVEGDDDGI
jgi:hypothetical protein